MAYSNRSEAEKARARRFFTGRPCKNGHVAERYTSNGLCVECQAARAVRDWKTRKERGYAWKRREGRRSFEECLKARRDPNRPFTPKQLALLQDYADGKRVDGQQSVRQLIVQRLGAGHFVHAVAIALRRGIID